MVKFSRYFRTKHIGVKVHNSNLLVADDGVHVTNIETERQKVDITSKSLSAVKVLEARLILLGYKNLTVSKSGFKSKG